MSRIPASEDPRSRQSNKKLPNWVSFSETHRVKAVKISVIVPNMPFGETACETVQCLLAQKLERDRSEGIRPHHH